MTTQGPNLGIDLDGAVREALVWLRRHPGRDTLDAATAVCNNFGWAANGPVDQRGRDWHDLLTSVRAEAPAGVR